MAATCEISNVFSNYFSTMYSSEDPTLASVPAAATFGADDLVLTLSNPQMPLEGTEKASWSGKQPQLWSKAQVLDWISYQVEKNKYDASAIDFSRCNMDGAALCSCAPEELRLVFGPLGDQLYSQLWDLTSSFPDELSWIIELLEKDSTTFQETLGDPGPFDQGSPFGQEMLDDCPQASPYYPGSYGVGAPSPGNSDVSTAGTGASQSSHSSDSGGSDVDLDPTDSKLFSSEPFPDYKKGDPKHGKRKRGRPRKLSKDSRDCLESKKSKHGKLCGEGPGAGGSSPVPAGCPRAPRPSSRLLGARAGLCCRGGETEAPAGRQEGLSPRVLPPAPALSAHAHVPPAGTARWCEEAAGGGWQGPESLGGLRRGTSAPGHRAGKGRPFCPPV
uniref:E74 like ETS transcription factor 3 n=1 Tax=Equus caballus TaxID=9796 RepID=A0A9L0R8U0_HORSE